MKYFEDWLFTSDKEIGHRTMQASLFPATFVAGWRAIQQNALFPNMKKIPVAPATGRFNYFGMACNAIGRM
jgi:hypothetical protein